MFIQICCLPDTVFNGNLVRVVFNKNLIIMENSRSAESTTCDYSQVKLNEVIFPTKIKTNL